MIHDNGGYLVALKWSMKNVYDIDPGDVYWAASDVGVGRRPLLHRLCAAFPRVHVHPLRRQARGHPRRRRFLARHRRS